MADKVVYVVDEEIVIGGVKALPTQEIAHTNPGRPGKVGVQVGFSHKKVEPQQWETWIRGRQIRRQH